MIVLLLETLITALTFYGFWVATTPSVDLQYLPYITLIAPSTLVSSFLTLAPISGLGE